MDIPPHLLQRHFAAMAVDEDNEDQDEDEGIRDDDAFSDISPGKVRKQARKRSEQIFKHWNMLQRILERHEDRIRKRWTKKTREQRKKVW